MDDERLLDLIASLRATRHFAPRPVPDPVLRRVLEVARWTGSARNRQPWRFVTVVSPDVREELGTLGAYARHLADAPMVIAIATDPQLGGADTTFDAGRACQNLALAAHASGLGSCPASLYPEERARRAARLVGLRAPWRVPWALAVGYPTDPPAGSPAISGGRLPLAELTWEI